MYTSLSFITGSSISSDIIIFTILLGIRNNATKYILEIRQNGTCARPLVLNRL